VISMNNRQLSFSNLKCNGVKRARTRRKFRPRILGPLPKFVQTIRGLGFLLFVLCLSCALPEGEVAQPIEILPSNRERQTPPIFGIRYIETLGNTGQGAGEFRTPLGLAIDESDRIYIADAGNNRVQVVDDAGNYIIEFGSRGWQTGEFDHPTDIALSFQRSYRLYVADTGNNRVQYCNFVDRIFYPLSESADDVLLDRPEGIGIGRNGEVYVVDTGNHRWIEFNVAGVPVVARGSFGNGSEQLWNPTDLDVDTQGNVYVVDTGNHLIKKYDFSGNPIDMWGGEGSALGQLREPKCIALDEWNYLYVTDSGNRRIQVFAPDGKSIAEFSVPALQEPAGIAVSKTGRVFVSDAEADDIKVFQVFRKK
jgi:DNA-binding beta-propeller fold protein YncE